MKSQLLFIVLSCLTAQAGYAGDAESDFGSANSRLETLFKQVSTTIYQITESSRQKQLFEQAQHAWSQFREAQANFDALTISAGGATFKTEYLRCSTKMTKERITYLESLLEPVRYKYKSTP